MSIATQITRIAKNVSDSLDAVAAKGVTVPTGSTSDDLPRLIAQITSGSGQGISIVETSDPGGGTIVTITGEQITLQSKTATPTTSQQTVTADNGYTGLSSVTVNAIPSQYIIPTGTKSISQNGTGIDVTNYAAVNVAVPGSTFVVTLEYNDSTENWEPTCTFAQIADAYAAGKTIQVCTDSTDAAADGWYTYDSPGDEWLEYLVEERYTDIGIPKIYLQRMVYNETGLRRSETAAYLYPEGTYTVSASGTFNIAKYASVSVPAGTAGTPTAIKGAVSNHSVSVTPSVSNQTGWITGSTKDGTAVTVSASELVSGTYNVSSSGTADVTNYASISVSSQTLPTATSGSATSGYTPKATISRSTSDQYINIPTGYNSAGAYYKINAVANGSATGPSSLSGTSATVSTSTNTLTLTKTGVTTTPTVSAGYVSAATASTATVTLTASVTTKAAATITPGTTNQTIASGTYLTGTQTISGDANLVAGNIISGKSIFGVSGSVVIQHYYTGSSTPSSSLGENGDIYLQTV